MFGRARGELERVSVGFDPALIDAPTAAAELDDVVAIENIAAGMRVRLAARVAERGCGATPATAAPPKRSRAGPG
jgi:hypothetical protein